MPRFILYFATQLTQLLQLIFIPAKFCSKTLTFPLKVLSHFKILTYSVAVEDRSLSLKTSLTSIEIESIQSVDSKSLPSSEIVFYHIENAKLIRATRRFIR